MTRAALANSLDSAIAPPQPERYRQEWLLFAFFVEGLSCIECLYYGLYFIGAMIDAGAFDPGIHPRNVTPVEVVKRYRARFNGMALTESLAALESGTEIDRWRIVRNTLSHRSSPGRHFSTDSEDAAWLGESLSAELIRRRTPGGHDPRGHVSRVLPGRPSPARAIPKGPRR